MRNQEIVWSIQPLRQRPTLGPDVRAYVPLSAVLRPGLSHLALRKVIRRQAISAIAAFRLLETLKPTRQEIILDAESMKSESLVIADQHAAVNTFPGLVHTARHTMGVGLTRRRRGNPGLAWGASRPRS